MRMIEGLQAVQRPAAVPICPARPVWYRVQTGAACPASGRVVAWSALVLARPALLPVLRSRSGCAVGWGIPAGHTATAQPRPVGRSTTEKIKKASKNSQPDFRPPKIFRKNKKTPTKGLCSVLYLPYKP